MTEIGLKILLARSQDLTSWSYARISAPYWKLYWNDRPGAHIVVSGKRTALGPDRFVVIPPETAYSTALTRPVRHLYLHFSAIPAYRSGGEVYRFEARRDLVALARQVDRLQDGPELTLALAASTLAHHALLEIPADGFQEEYPDPRVREAVKRMGADMAERHPNSHLAQGARMNVNSFIRLFRLTTGLSPQAYLAGLRIRHACMLLHYTERTIDDIAEATGFCDRYHFSRVFKRLRGIGPAAFRRDLECASLGK